MDRLFQVEREKVIFVMIDAQEGLAKAMDTEIARQVLRNLKILIAFAKDLGIPVVLTEQYPRGLGSTVSEIRHELASVSPIEKVAFSCCGARGFNERLNRLGRKQILVAGMEAHVCVLQTAGDLIQAGYEVHVVADAVCSRKKLDWETGLRWMEKRGAMISTTEIVAFQLLREAGTEEFKRLSKLVK